jgi:hypothetical protein
MKLTPKQLEVLQSLPGCCSSSYKPIQQLAKLKSPFSDFDVMFDLTKAGKAYLNENEKE